MLWVCYVNLLQSKHSLCKYMSLYSREHVPSLDNYGQNSYINYKHYITIMSLKFENL